MAVGDGTSPQKQSECQQLFIWIITEKINMGPGGNVVSCCILGLLQSVCVACFEVCKDCVTFKVCSKGILAVNFLPKKTQISFGPCRTCTTNHEAGNPNSIDTLLQSCSVQAQRSDHVSAL